MEITGSCIAYQKNSIEIYRILYSISEKQYRDLQDPVQYIEKIVWRFIGSCIVCWKNSMEIYRILYSISDKQYRDLQDPVQYIRKIVWRFIGSCIVYRKNSMEIYRVVNIIQEKQNIQEAWDSCFCNNIDKMSQVISDIHKQHILNPRFDLKTSEQM